MDFNGSAEDEGFVRAANSGDKAGFDGIYLKYREWVYGLGWRFTGSRDDAQDVVQEVFIYLLGKFPGFELRANFKTFLYPVVKNISAKYRQRRGIPVDNEVLDLFAAKGEARGDYEELARAVAGLGAEVREIIAMRYADEMSLEEIAQALGMPVNTCKSRLYRGLEQLRGSVKLRE